MMRRTPLLRFLSLLWAGLQLATPALGTLADARFAAAAGDPVSHVESTSSSTCPVIHAPDCAVCRYLSGAAPAPEAAEAVDVHVTRMGAFIAAGDGPATLAIVLPDGRAPPGI